MTLVAAPLGILACLSMAGSASGATLTASHDAVCYGGRDAPKEPPDLPTGCHATMNCAEHRKLRTFP